MKRAGRTRDEKIHLVTAYDDPNAAFSGTTWKKYLEQEEKRMRSKRDNVRIVTRLKDGFIALAR